MDSQERIKRKKRRLIMRTAVLFSIVAAAGYVFYSNFFQEEAGVLNEGDVAPNFVLQNMEGKQVELHDFRGEGVFLNFWGTYCPPCEEEMPYMEAEHQKYLDEDVEILAVNVGESKLTVDRFMKRLQLSFPILLDQNRDVLNQYGVSYLPATYLINQNGEVVHIHVGGMSEENVQDFMTIIDPNSP
uniref:thiol-disulfide oxidoreductase ResA n=1 Tax=Bacillaceae bacterium JMAK1 TaxID=1028381 RepID=UPI0003AC2A22|nr:thiol-disulfide oxidoreductase ResA [Bacillaceae bacterium JMAK1]AGQ45453.1 thiol-disulfide oxidoreductase resA [Bacillaceae bacterium JMAK1]